MKVGKYTAEDYQKGREQGLFEKDLLALGKDSSAGDITGGHKDDLAWLVFHSYIHDGTGMGTWGFSDSLVFIALLFRRPHHHVNIRILSGSSRIAGDMIPDSFGKYQCLRVGDL